MLAKLLLLFTLVPLLELALLLEIGRRIGTGDTLVLILATGVVGALVARRQGVAVLRRIQTELIGGQLPGPTMVEGVIILLAGALLITPGILTDIVGFLCLVPATRRVIRALLWRAFTRALQRGRASVEVRVDHWPTDD